MSTSPFPHVAGSTTLFVALLVELFAESFGNKTRFWVSSPQATASENDKKAKPSAMGFMWDFMGYLIMASVPPQVALSPT